MKTQQFFSLRLLFVVLISFANFLLTGCSIFSSKSSNTEILQSGIIFRARVEIPTVSGSKVRSSIAPSISTLSSADVELYLQGHETAYKMQESSTEPGVYSTFIPLDPTNASMAACIMAKKDKIVMVNIIPNIASATTSQDSYLKTLEAPVNSKSTAISMIVVMLLEEYSNDFKFQSISDIPKVIKYIDNQSHSINISNNAKISLDIVVSEAEKGTYNSIINKIQESIKNVQTNSQNFTNINNILELQDLKNQITDAIQSSTIQDKIIPQDTSLEDNSKLFLNMIVKFLSGAKLSTSESNNLSNILSDDFIYNGRNRQNLIDYLRSDSVEKHERILQSHSLGLVYQKISDTLYKIHAVGNIVFKDTASNQLFTLNVDSRKNGLDFDINFSEYNSDTLKPFIYFPVLVKKVGDTWKIAGNGLRIEDIIESDVESFTSANSSGISNSYIKSNFKVKLSNIFRLPNDQSDNSRSWLYKNNNKYRQILYDSMETGFLVGWLFEREDEIKNEDIYTLDLIFDDNKNQKINLKLRGLDSKFFDKPDIVVTLENGKLVVDWAKCLYGDFLNYEILVNGYKIDQDNKDSQKSPIEINIYSSTIFTVSPTYRILDLPSNSTLSRDDMYSINVTLSINRLSGLKRTVLQAFYYDEIKVYDNKLPSVEDRFFYGSEATVEFARP